MVHLLFIKRIHFAYWNRLQTVLALQRPFIQACIKENIKHRVIGFVTGIHQFPHKGLVTRKMFPFDDVSMEIKKPAKANSGTPYATKYGEYCHPQCPE